MIMAHREDDSRKRRIVDRLEINPRQAVLEFHLCRQAPKGFDGRITSRFTARAWVRAERRYQTRLGIVTGRGKEHADGEL